jgi:hypothetical protein
MWTTPQLQPIRSRELPSGRTSQTSLGMLTRLVSNSLGSKSWRRSSTRSAGPLDQNSMSDFLVSRLIEAHRSSHTDNSLCSSVRFLGSTPR